VTDLATGVCHSKFRHGSGSGEQYSGVTRIHCMSAPCTSSATSVFFSGCSAGILKAWTMPVESPLTPASPGQSSASSYWGISMNLRSKQSLSVMKVHAAPISYLVAKPSDAPGGWLLASGDMKGLVCLNRGSEKSSSATCCSTSMHSSASPKPSTASSAAAGVSCLAFIGATALSPSGAEGAAAGGGKAKTAKKGGTTGGAGSGMTAGMSGAAAGGSEQYLGVGTASGLISVLDLCTAQAVYQVSGHAGRVTQMIGLQSNEFITASTDRSIKLWDIRTRSRPTQNFAGKILEERSLGPSSDKRCATSPITAIAVGGGDNSLVISTSADGTVRLWDRRYDVNVPCSVSQGHSNRITAIAWNGVGEFHTASHDGTVRSWDSINGQNTHLLQAHEEEGITGMRMTSFRCAQHISITPRGPVTFTDYDKLSARTCLVTCGWNGTMRAFVYDV
jgi:WD40 repeat protein